MEAILSQQPLPSASDIGHFQLHVYTVFYVVFNEHHKTELFTVLPLHLHFTDGKQECRGYKGTCQRSDSEETVRSRIYNPSTCKLALKPNATLLLMATISMKQSVSI